MRKREDERKNMESDSSNESDFELGYCTEDTKIFEDFDINNNQELTNRKRKRKFNSAYEDIETSSDLPF